MSTNNTFRTGHAENDPERQQREKREREMKEKHEGPSKQQHPPGKQDPAKPKQR